jgi:hypothetical protein
MTNLIVLGIAFITNTATMILPSSESNSVYCSITQQVCCVAQCTDIGTTNGYIYSIVTVPCKKHVSGCNHDCTFGIGYYDDRAKLYAKKEDK